MAFPPSGQPPQAPPQGQPQESGGVSQLVGQIYQGLSKLMEALSSSQAVDDNDKQALGAIIQAYEQFVEQNLGSAPGQSAQPKGPPRPPQGEPNEMAAGAANPRRVG